MAHRQKILRNCKPDIGDNKSNLNDEMKDMDTTPVQLKSYASRPLCCNGDCGSQFAKLIDNIIHPKNKDTEHIEEQIIHHTFWLPDSPLRQTLIKQIENQPFLTDNDQLKQMLTQLRDETCYIKGNEFTNKIISYFHMLRAQGYIHILQTLANQTCLVPNRSLFEELSAYNKRKKNKKLNEINSKLTDMFINNINNDQEKHRLITERNNLKQQISKWNSKPKILQQLQELKKERAQLQKYEARIKRIKSGIRYQQMKKRNMPLTDMELYAVLTYCDENGYCSRMRESQREQNKYNISCEWKTFFYHLCCAVYKIREIFHHRNSNFKNEFVMRQPQNNKLYRGISGFKTLEEHHPLHTISSFTHHIHIAQEFVSVGNGMIIALYDAFKQIYKGQLMAADVSWISGFPAEGEFLVAPISLNKHRQIDCKDASFPTMYNMDWDKVNVLEITDYISQPLTAVRHNVSQRIQDPMTLLEAMLPIRNHNISQFIVAAIFLGGLTDYMCRVCHVKSRLCEYVTSLLDGNIECPACRALYAQYPNLTDKQMDADELECYNLDCKSLKKGNGTIKHITLEQVEEKERDWGYKCRTCLMQQRKALADRYLNEQYLDKVSERLIYHMEKVFETDDEKQQIDVRKDKKTFIDILKYTMHCDRVKEKNKGEIFVRFPIIFVWMVKWQGLSLNRLDLTQLIGLISGTTITTNDADNANENNTANMFRGVGVLIDKLLKNNQGNTANTTNNSANNNTDVENDNEKTKIEKNLDLSLD